MEVKEGQYNPVRWRYWAKNSSLLELKTPRRSARDLKRLISRLNSYLDRNAMRFLKKSVTFSGIVERMISVYADFSTHCPLNCSYGWALQLLLLLKYLTPPKQIVPLLLTSSTLYFHIDFEESSCCHEQHANGLVSIHHTRAASRSLPEFRHVERVLHFVQYRRSARNGHVCLLQNVFAMSFLRFRDRFVGSGM